jgi:translation initiation factor 4G
MSNYAVSDNIPAGPGDPRRTAPGLNGFGSMPERTAYSPRENLVPRHVGPAASDQWNAQDRSMIYANRPLAASPPSQGQGPALNQSLPAEKVYSEDSLRDMSTGAIKEFYSARDEKEVALCIKDLNSPSFHPSMISLWVNDSFERKDKERDLLASLLVSLTRSHDGVLNQLQLIKGFESVLTTLEDAVNDAPKAPEFLGSIFAKVVLENVVSLIEIGQLLREGGEERGSLLEFGLAGDVLGNTLEKIKSEKGEAFLNDIRSSSSLRVEDFQPPIATNRSRILEKFI